MSFLPFFAKKKNLKNNTLPFSSFSFLKETSTALHLASPIPYSGDYSPKRNENGVPEGASMTQCLKSTATQTQGLLFLMHTKKQQSVPIYNPASSSATK